MHAFVCACMLCVKKWVDGYSSSKRNAQMLGNIVKLSIIKQTCNHRVSASVAVSGWTLSTVQAVGHHRQICCAFCQINADILAASARFEMKRLLLLMSNLLAEQCPEHLLCLLSAFRVRHCSIEVSIPLK